MNSREHHLVQLVGADGSTIGEMTVEDAHRAPGRLHRAFSVLLRSPDGRLLLQQRAATKTRFALRWANACCGHPMPGDTVTDAAARRLAEELGVTGVPLREVGVHLYQAEDPATGRVEFEHDHVLVGTFAGEPPAIDPAEVATVEWVDPEELFARVARRPDCYAPWLAGVLDAWRSSAR
ncbi:isopentenyl-diphosphate Delta-isomerase [Rhizomonospora bruguierae]|uniref:isopentenyl-diphosphate Delta-isomerase n=1 Tax=Rhizomonospora bruguierae TaxID=1581705 RepID=UPI001BCBD3AF|nr:isopentenyl-diphosphate Delta-isomerase [Micromonospora sp. NBRC 107566]